MINRWTVNSKTNLAIAYNITLWSEGVRMNINMLTYVHSAQFCFSSLNCFSQCHFEPGRGRHCERLCARSHFRTYCKAESCSRSSTGTTSQYNKMKIAQSHRPRWLLWDKQNGKTVLQMSLGMLLCHESY